MAGQSEKKLAKQAQEAKKKYLLAIVIANAIYIPLVILANFSELTKTQWAGFILLSGVTYFTFGSISSSLELGVPVEYSQDVFIINLVVQVGSCYSSYFWYLYLVVPTYAMYKAGTFLWGWFRAPTPEDDPEEAAKRKKAEEKKAKKAERQQFKTMRR
uniref:Transmembrane protein 208 n=1 Tax=Oxyrrhis marina TaxID=2969 RepID=A0A7S3UP21_OXYMA